MNTCLSWPCQRDSGGYCSICHPPRSFPSFIPPTPSSRTLSVNIPFSNIGITIVTLDGYGNVTIKVDQPYPQESASD